MSIISYFEGYFSQQRGQKVTLNVEYEKFFQIKKFKKTINVIFSYCAIGKIEELITYVKIQTQCARPGRNYILGGTLIVIMLPFSIFKK